jgi:hypothetical protein
MLVERLHLGMRPPSSLVVVSASGLAAEPLVLLPSVSMPVNRNPIAELLLVEASPEECRAAAAHYRALAEVPENAAIREEILRVAARFER